MAEYYSAELAQKIRRGMDLNAQKCLCTGGNDNVAAENRNRCPLIQEQRFVFRKKTNKKVSLIL